MKWSKKWGLLIFSIGFLSACSNSVEFAGNELAEVIDPLEGLDEDAKAFALTVYPVVQQYCADCHSENSPNAAQNPFFADPDDIQYSYDGLMASKLVNFDNPAGSRIVEKVALLHNCWDPNRTGLADCEASAQVLESAVIAWAAQRTPDNTSEGKSFRTTEVSIDLEMGDPDPGDDDPDELAYLPKTFSIDLSEVSSDLPADTILEVDIAVLGVNGYHFVDTRITSTVPIEIEGIYIFLNGVETNVNQNDYQSMAKVFEFTEAAETLPLTLEDGSYPAPIVTWGEGLSGDGGPGIDRFQFAFDYIGAPR